MRVSVQGSTEERECVRERRAMKFTARYKYAAVRE